MSAQTNLASSRRLFVLLAAGILPAGFLAAQAPSAEPAPVSLAPQVITATRTPAAATTLGTAFDTLDAAEIARRQLPSLRAALGGIPGAPAFASGAPGGSTSLFLRGANSNQTLFLVDGIRLNDPNTDYLVWLGGACVGACDSLEVAHGPQSTLYGGEAIGGVIALRAQRGEGAPRGSVAVEAGSFGTTQGAVSAQGVRGPWAWNASATGGRTENDRPNNDFTSATWAARIDRRVTDAVAVGATVRGFMGAYGSPGTRFTNDPDNEERESNQLVTAFAEFTHSPDLGSRAVLGGQWRRFVSDNPGPSGRSVTIVKNRRAVLDWQASFTGVAGHRVTGGITAEANHTRNTGFGNIDEGQRLFAVFLQDEFSPADGVFVTAGLRSDDHDTFGRATTGRATVAWVPGGGRLKLRASYGTAFRAPSFLDLYGRSSFYVGNPNLAPEEARGWDAGADWYLPDGWGVVSLSWFDTRLRDLVVFDFGVFPSTVRNVERARTRGVEFAAKATLPGAIELRAAYTWLEADNLSQGSRLLRRPRHSGSLDLWRAFGGGFSAGAAVAWAAQREDVHAATFGRIDGEDYAVVRAYAAWAASERLTLKARAENLLGERYEEVHGFPQPGAAVFAGAEWRF
ncbi:MAG TPA: TonB-dependent receptor [Opitutaceae bacterium]|nr:TonB-dependent receptor [Opitutaceae bacterium]